MKSVKNIWDRIKAEKKLLTIVLAGLVGIGLIAASELLPVGRAKKRTPQPAQTPACSYEEQIEKRLSSVISEIRGVGRAEVMVAIDSSCETFYAKNEKEESKTEGENMQKSYTGNYVLAGGGQGIVLKTDEPKVRGVIVVCEGGDSASVRKDITDAVTSVLSVDTNHVCVLRMKHQEEKT